VSFFFFFFFGFGLSSDSPREAQGAYFDCVNDPQDTRMSQCPKLAHGILRQRKARFVDVDVEGEYTAI
jgi:hypothetical protein